MKDSYGRCIYDNHGHVCVCPTLYSVGDRHKFPRTFNQRPARYCKVPVFYKRRNNWKIGKSSVHIICLFYLVFRRLSTGLLTGFGRSGITNAVKSGHRSQSNLNVKITVYGHKTNTFWGYI
jgi:hypothetical protein